MVLTCNSNIMNMIGFNNCYSGMSGMCGYGAGALGSIWGGSFYDCNGLPNYDAMAGYGVASVVLNVAGQVLGAYTESKQEEKTAANEEITDIKNELKAQKEIYGNGQVEQKYTDAVTNAETKLSTAESDLKNLQEAKNKIDISNPDEEGYTEKLKKYNELDAAITKKQNEIAELEASKNAASEAKIARENEIKKAEAEIKKLEKKLQEINEAKAEKELQKACGKRNKDLDVTKFEKGPYTGEVEKQDISQLIHLFLNAKDDNEKRKYAQALVNIDSTVFLNAASNSQGNVRKLANDWLTNHPAS